MSYHNQYPIGPEVRNGPGTVILVDTGGRMTTLLCQDLTVRQRPPQGWNSRETMSIDCVGEVINDPNGPVQRLNDMAEDLDAFLSDIQDEDIDDVTRSFAEDLRLRLVGRIKPSSFESRNDIKISREPFIGVTARTFTANMQVPSSKFLDTLLGAAPTKLPNSKQARAQKVNDQVSAGVISVPTNSGFVPVQVSQ